MNKSFTTWIVHKCLLSDMDAQWLKCNMPLGFEYGYSTAELDTLVVWEAPEGDKTSKAQVIIDHFIAGGFVKYNYHSNIVLLLPHYLKCWSFPSIPDIWDTLVQQETGYGFLSNNYNFKEILSVKKNNFKLHHAPRRFYIKKNPFVTCGDPFNW